MPARPHFVRAGGRRIRFARIKLLSGENYEIFAKVKQAKIIGNIKAFADKSSTKKHPSKNFTVFSAFLTGVFNQFILINLLFESYLRFVLLQIFPLNP